MAYEQRDMSGALFKNDKGEVNSIDNDYLAFMRTLKRELAAERKRADQLQSMYDAATEIQGYDEAIKYVTSGNSVPVTRCTVSADLLRQLIEGRETERKRADEAEADAKRWRAVPAFLEKYQINYVGLLSDVDAFNRDDVKNG